MQYYFPICAAILPMVIVSSVSGASRNAAALAVDDALQMRILRGHSDEVRYLAFSPDGTTLATSGLDGTTRLWDLKSGSELRQIVQRQKELIPELAFTADGKNLAEFGRYYDYKVRLWQIATGVMQYQFEQDALRTGRANLGVGLAFAANGKTMAVAALRSKTIDFRDSVTGNKVGELKCRDFAPGGFIETFAISPDSETMAISSTQYANGDQITLWHMQRKIIRCLLPKKGVHNQPPKILAFSSDGKTLAEVIEGTVRLWDIEARKQTHTFEQRAHIQAFAFTKSGSALAFLRRPQFEVWDVMTAKKTHLCPARPGTVMNAVFSPDGRVLAIGMRDGTVGVWDLAGDRE